MKAEVGMLEPGAACGRSPARCPHGGLQGRFGVALGAAYRFMGKHSHARD